MRERGRTALLALPSELLALDGNGECYRVTHSERCVAAMEHIDFHPPQLAEKKWGIRAAVL